MKKDEFSTENSRQVPRVEVPAFEWRDDVNCQTCQHWERYDDELGECEKLAVGNYIEELSGAQGIFARDSEQANGDGSGYSPVYTEPTFSCAFYEADPLPTDR